MKIHTVSKGFIALLILGMLCAGCESESKKIEIYMNLPGSPLDFDDPAGGVKTFSVSTNTIKWEAVSSDPSLFRVTQSATSKNGEVTVTAERNTASKKKEATITVTGTGIETRTVRVSIAGAPQTLSVTPSALTFPVSGESLPFTVTSNTEWEISYDAAWLTVTPKEGSDNGNITVKAEANAAVTERETEIKVSCANAQTQVIQVKQEATAPSLKVSPASFTFTQAAGQQYLTVNSNTDWEVESSAPSWLTVTPVKGSNEQRVTVSVTANGVTQRTAEITVRVTGTAIAQTIRVTQAAAVRVLTVSPSELTFSAGGESKTVTVTSNTDWDVSISPSSSSSWLTVSPSKGSSNGSFRVTAAANTTLSERTATVSVTGTGVTAKTIRVTQQRSAQELNVSPSSLTFSSGNETKDLTVTSNTNWTVGSGVTWLSLSRLTGSSNGTVAVTALANTSFSPRSGSIIVRREGSSSGITIPVEQAGVPVLHFLDVRPMSLPFSYLGGKQTMKVSSDTGWNIIINNSDSWIKVSHYRGSGIDMEVDVTTIPNPYTHERTGFIVFQIPGIPDVSVRVTQSYTANPFLTVSTDNMTFSGSSETKEFEIFSNTSWSITKSSGANWLTILPENGAGHATVRVGVSRNSPLQRQATITVSGGASIVRTITVRQAGY